MAPLSYLALFALALCSSVHALPSPGRPNGEPKKFWSTKRCWIASGNVLIELDEHGKLLHPLPDYCVDRYFCRGLSQWDENEKIVYLPEKCEKYVKGMKPKKPRVETVEDGLRPLDDFDLGGRE